MTLSHPFVDAALATTVGRDACIAAWPGFFGNCPDPRNVFDWASGHRTQCCRQGRSRRRAKPRSSSSSGPVSRQLARHRDRGTCGNGTRPPVEDPWNGTRRPPVARCGWRGDELGRTHHDRIVTMLSDVVVERDGDGALVVSWSNADGPAVDVGVGSSPAPAEHRHVATSAAGLVRLTVDTGRAYVSLRPVGGDTTIVARAADPVRRDHQPPRSRRLPASEGGTTRWGWVYRADALHKLTEADSSASGRWACARSTTSRRRRAGRVPRPGRVGARPDRRSARRRGPAAADRTCRPPTASGCCATSTSASSSTARPGSARSSAAWPTRLADRCCSTATAARTAPVSSPWCCCSRSAWTGRWCSTTTRRPGAIATSRIKATAWPTCWPPESRRRPRRACSAPRGGRWPTQSMQLTTCTAGSTRYLTSVAGLDRSDVSALRGWPRRALTALGCAHDQSVRLNRRAAAGQLPQAECTASSSTSLGICSPSQAKPPSPCGSASSAMLLQCTRR